MRSRFALVKRKLVHYRKEILAAKEGRLWEIVVSGLLVVVLFPLLLETVWLLLTGLDLGLLQSSELTVHDELKIQKVPEELRDLRRPVTLFTWHPSVMRLISIGPSDSQFRGKRLKPVVIRAERTGIRTCATGRKVA